MKQSPIFSLWIAIATIALHTKTNAAEFAVPDWADNANARFSQWLNFTSAHGEPGNSPDVEGSNADGLLTQSVPGAVITGSGNIYNRAAPSVFLLTHGADSSSYETVVLQTKIIGDMDAENVALEYEKGGRTESIKVSAVEIARESGGFGDTIIYQWTWNLSDLGLTRISIRFGAVGAHASLVGVRLDILLKTTETGEVIEASFDKPSQDRWNYPWNSTPGVRSLASLFRATDEVGVYRHGTFIVGFDTSDLIPEGNASGAYRITSAQLRLMTSGDFEVPYDPSYDPVASHLPETHELYLADEDPGRPVQVFGTGFRNDFNIETWNETTPYSPGSDAQRTVFPIILDEGGLPKDVSLAVDYSNPSDTAPFAVGKLEDTGLGDLILGDTWMTFDIDLNNFGTLDYLQRGLAQGKLSFTFTSLNGGGRELRTYPEFYTGDHLVGEAPQLQISLRIMEASILPAPPRITGIRRTADGITIQFISPESSAFGIRWTPDFISWAEVASLAIEPLGNGQYEWTDSQANDAVKFYRVFITP